MAGRAFILLFGALVMFGALAQVLKNPGNTVTLLGSGASTISGLTKDLEGRG